MRIALLALAALALTSTASAQTAQRYTIDFAVVEGGKAIVSARALITEGGQAEVNLVGADGAYTFTADLQPEQGDGDGRLSLEAYLNRDGEDLVQPRLLVERGGHASVRIGTSSAGSDGLQEGVEINFAPIAD